jgi:uncharacterized protein YlxW (UPF0749 family)
MSNATTARFTSLCIKSVGTVLIASSLVDYITLAIPFHPWDAQWQIAFTSQVVDRGIAPIVGIALILMGDWINSNAIDNNGKTAFDLKFPVFVLSLFLGIMFLVLVPIHLLNLQTASADALSQIAQKAGQAETIIGEQYGQLQDLANNPQRLQQLESRIKDLNTAISQKQFQGQKLTAEQIKNLQETQQQLVTFRELAKNPATLKTRLEELQAKLQDEKLQRESLAKTEAIEQGIRIGLTSFMLSIGYLIIGGVGLQKSGGMGIGDRAMKTSA